MLNIFLMQPLQMAKRDYIVGDVIDQGWGDDYLSPYCIDNQPSNHQMQFLMSVDTREDCHVPPNILKSWQIWLARESTVFELAKRIVVNNDYINVVRMTKVLTYHYVKLLKKHFPKNISAQFREDVTQEGMFNS